MSLLPHATPFPSSWDVYIIVSKKQEQKQPKQNGLRGGVDSRDDQDRPESIIVMIAALLAAAQAGARQHQLGDGLQAEGCRHPPHVSHAKIYFLKNIFLLHEPSVKKYLLSMKKYLTSFQKYSPGNC